MKFREHSGVTMDLSIKHEGNTLHAQGLSQSARKMSLNFSGSQGDTGHASDSSPTYGTTNDTFPYGLSGVAMPNYGYPGDLYQFTSNGYPRKSRTCCYCGKVFTRSTTRRYHEKRCPLLRAAVCGIVPDNGKRSNGPSGSLPHMTSPSLSQTLERKSLSSTSSVTGGSHPPPHYTTTSRITTPPPPLLGMKRGGEEENGLGYHTSVIVKQELQDHIMKHEHNQDRPSSIPSSSHEYPGIMTRLTPDSNGSSPRPAKGMGELEGYPLSPFHIQSRLDSSKSPSQTSPKDDANSTTLETQIEEDSSVKTDKQNGLDEEEITDVESFQERMKDDEARASDLNLTSPGMGERSSLLMDVHETTSPNMSQENQLEAISDAEDSKNEPTDGINTFVDAQTKCAVCGKHFESSWKLHVHEQIHTKFKPYACRFCGLRFSKAALRITHEKLHISETSLLCAICGDTFTRRDSLQIHVSSRHSEGPWLCRHCGKAAMSHQELLEHFQTHDIAKEEMLSLEYFLQGTLSYNVSNNNDNEDDLNDSELINDSELLNDSENINDNEFISMSDSNDNDNSMVSPEPGEDGVIDDLTPVKQPDSLMAEDNEMCTICGREYPKSHMSYHLKAHEGQKPYECPICGKRFGYKNNMKSHIKLHAGIKPYQCNVCGAKFTRGSTLRRHARRHGISAESVWDLFVRNGNSSQQQPHQLGASQLPARNSTEKMIPSPSSPNMNSSLELTSTMSDSPGYSNLLNTATSAAMSNALLMSYHNHQAAIAAATYPTLFSPLQSTSDVPQHSAGFAASSHSPQRDALNLTIHRSVAALPHADFNGNNRNLTDSVSPTSAERSRSRSLSGSDISRPTPISAPSMTGNGHDIGVQVKTCCKINIENMYPGIGSPSEASVQSGDSGAIYQQGQSSGLDNSTETISALLTTGRLFKCDHCECYFSEYAMYRIHSKIHTRGRTMPFVCPVCGEDCHDRVYFSLHISEHLK